MTIIVIVSSHDPPQIYDIPRLPYDIENSHIIPDERSPYPSQFSHMQKMGGQLEVMI